MKNMENKGINVLSLFDGMSCGQIALNKIGMKVNNYYASEIDKYAQIVSKANYPNTIYIGDVRKISIDSLLPIDLLIGGSPCQSFSFAGKRAGMTTKTNIEILQLEHYLELKEQNFEFEGQSYLFWEYIKALTEIRKYNPNVKFLLENVIMGAKWQKVITQAIGINPICLNSSLLSAQNRERLYWTNINSSPSGFFDDFTCKIAPPKDKKILLKDILEKEVSKKYYLSEKLINGFEKHKIRHDEKGTGFGFKPKNDLDKGNSLRANAALCPTDNTIIVNERKIIHEGNLYGQNTRVGIYGKNGICPAITASSGMGGGHIPMIEIKKNKIEFSTHLTYNQEKTIGKKNDKSHSLMSRDYKGFGNQGMTGVVNQKRKVHQLSTNNKSNGGTQPYQQDRIYDINGISPALQSQLCTGSSLINTPSIRRLTPIECERLQTVPDNYTNYVSDSQRYKMIGNGWTVDIVAYILNYYKKEFYGE